MRYCVCCEINKHSSGLLLSQKAILDVLRQHVELIYGRPPVVKARLFQWEYWIDDRLDTSIDESLENLEGGTQ